MLPRCFRFEIMLFILGSLTVNACNQADRSPSVDGLQCKQLEESALSISSPEKGKVVQLCYFPQHPKAHFKKVDTLIASITVYTEDDYRLNRIKMVNTSEHFHAEYTIPSGATYIAIAVSPPRIYQTPETASASVLENDEYVQYSLPQAMMYSDNREYLQALFDKDSLLYPEEYTRWIALILGSIKLGASQEEIEKLCTSLLARVDTDSSVTARQQFDAYTALLVANLRIAALERIKSTIDTLNLVARRLSSRNEKQTMASSIALSWVITSQFRAPVFKDIVRQEDMLNSLAAVSETLRSPYLLDHIASNGMRNDSLIIKFPQVYSRVVAAIAKNGTQWSDCDLSTNTGIFVSAASCSRILNQLDHLSQLEKGNERLLTLSAWEPAYDTQCVCIFDTPSIYVATVLKLAKMYREHRKDSAARTLLYRILKTQGPEVKGAQSLASIEFGKLFLSEKQLDSAEKYIAIAEHLSSPFVDPLSDELHKLQRSQGIEPLDKESLLAKYAQYKPKELSEPIFGDLPTNKGAVPYKSARPLFLLFSGAECGVCREYMPGIYRELIKHFPKENVILVTPDAPALVRELYGEVAMIAPLTPELEQRHRVQILPSIQVIRDNAIVFKRPSISETTARQLISMFR